MDSGSVVNRSKKTRMGKSDNVDNAKESVEKVPKVLSPEIRDVLPIFASMLDIKSFTKLATTSKEMHRRCMENKSITISLEKVKLVVSSRRLEFIFEVAEDEPVVLQKLPCKVNVCTLEVQDSAQPQVYVGSMVQRMREYGINKIHELHVKNRATDGETITAIIKDFDVKSVNIDRPVEIDVLRSIIQLNLEKFAYHGPVSIDFILQIDSPIGEIHFPEVPIIAKNELLEIMSKIQSGSLRRLNLNSNAVNFGDFSTQWFELPLPSERPLLLARSPDSDDSPSEYWFIHWHGGVTRCVLFPFSRNQNSSTVQLSKCEEWELSYILRKDEDVLKDLAERRPRVCCSASHFQTFSSNFTMIDLSHEGPLPISRPLYCKVSENNFWMLEKDDLLMECTWEDGSATRELFSPYNRHKIGHPALARYMFWKLLERVERSDEFSLYRHEGPEELLENFKKLDFEYSRALPKARPLIFERRRRRSMRLSRVRVILLEDRLIQCTFMDDRICIRLCENSYRPPILFTAKNVMEMLQRPSSADFKIRFEMFWDAVEQLKISIFALQKRLLILEKSKTEIWYMLDGDIVHATWKHWRLYVSEEKDLRNAPPNFVKQVMKCLAEKKAGHFIDSLILDLEQFNSFLEQFVVVPFDYSDPLTNDSPLAFVKNQIHHTCRKSPTRTLRCRCTDHSVLVWLLLDGVRVKRCACGQKPSKISYFCDAPRSLGSKEFLKNLLQYDYEKWSNTKWFGQVDDFHVYLKDYAKLPFDYVGPLPEERPLLFEGGEKNGKRADFLLREDGTVVKCVYREYFISFSLCTHRDDFVPPALVKML